MADLRLTVAICTWNRASLLARTLERIARIRAPAADWEVVVVDNNCSDETPRLLESFLPRLPLRIAFEPKPGLSHARNAAVACARGDYIVWTDDDVLVGDDWLRAYERAIGRWPDASVFGGPIKPWFDGTPPPWLASVWEEVADAFAVRDLGPVPVRLDGRRKAPFGANYVVRTAEQRAFRYDPQFGRKLQSGLLGEESFVIKAILDAGHGGWWVPDASVEHFIPKDRQSIRYLRRYFGMWGKTMRSQETESVPTLLGRPRWALRQAVQAEVAYRVLRLTGDARRWIRPLRDASTYWGVAARP